jgi:hypothetical protein
MRSYDKIAAVNVLVFFVLLLVLLFSARHAVRSFSAGDLQSASTVVALFASALWATHSLSKTASDVLDNFFSRLYPRLKYAAVVVAVGFGIITFLKIDTLLREMGPLVLAQAPYWVLLILVGVSAATSAFWFLCLAHSMLTSKAPGKENGWENSSPF